MVIPYQAVFKHYGSKLASCFAVWTVGRIFLALFRQYNRVDCPTSLLSHIESYTQTAEISVILLVYKRLQYTMQGTCFTLLFVWVLH
jgi:hypothetical protein